MSLDIGNSIDNGSSLDMNDLLTFTESNTAGIKIIGDGEMSVAAVSVKFKAIEEIGKAKRIIFFAVLIVFFFFVKLIIY